MASAAENRKNGAKKLVLGLTVGIVTGLTYGVVLPIGVISSFVGIACVAAGATMQGMAPSKDGRSYALGSAIRFAGACALSFGFGAIAGPTAGPIYSAEGVYNASTGKELNIFGKTMGFVFGLVAGPEYREDEPIVEAKNDNKTKKLEITKEINPELVKQAKVAAKGSKIVPDTDNSPNSFTSYVRNFVGKITGSSQGK